MACCLTASFKNVSTKTIKTIFRTINRLHKIEQTALTECLVDQTRTLQRERTEAQLIGKKYTCHDFETVFGGAEVQVASGMRFWSASGQQNFYISLPLRCLDGTMTTVKACVLVSGHIPYLFVQVWKKCGTVGVAETWSEGERLLLMHAEKNKFHTVDHWSVSDTGTLVTLTL